MILTVLLALTAPAERLHFENDILPILSRHACNASGCHGKAEGQNGFKLSVFGFDPEADYEALVKEGRGRRFLPAAPESSLFLRKMSGAMPHGGGARIRPGTRDYQTLHDWVAAGLPRGNPDAPRVIRVRVEPGEQTLQAGASLQLRVFARYSDGREADVTSLARFSTNNEALATVDADGRVTAGSLPGGAAIMANFLNVYDVFHVLVPRRQKLERFPDESPLNEIDNRVNARLKKLQIAPSDTCDDATFLRRVHLDLIGRLPSLDEARAFLASREPAKRDQLVARLLERPEFADYWALKWADLLRVDRAALGPKRARAYHGWIRTQIARATPLDQFARAVLTAEGPLDEVPPTLYYRATKKPGEQAAGLAQVFLGVRVACAECHHHPFDRWSQDDYHGLAAYFTGAKLVKLGPIEALEIQGLAAVTQPRTKQRLFARPLAAKPPTNLEPGDRRAELADWMIAPDNPWFARNLANRVWAHLLGRGLVEPVDDVRDTNPPTNPELLDLLAHHLVRHKYDLRSLIRFITASRTYQRSTLPTPSNADDTQNFSRTLLRRVPAEVLLDMICDTTGVGERFPGAPVGTRAVQLWDSKVNHYFLKAFGRPERTGACECDRNSEPAVAQVLHLLNAPEIESKLSHAAGRVARLEKSLSNDTALIEALYLTFYSRLPSEKETATAKAHLKSAVTRRQGAEDLAWALLNTTEFSFNH